MKGGKVFPVELSDEALIHRYNRGDLAALDTLVERYRKPLYNFIWRLAGNEADSDEIFQETWMKFITKSKTFKKERFKGWIYTVARNLVFDRYRRKRKQVSLDAPAANDTGHNQSLGDKLADEQPPPDRLASRSEMEAAIAGAVARLPEQLREVFILRMEADMAFKDIAKLQGVSINTALSRMQYAVTNLRKVLRDYAPKEETT